MFIEYSYTELKYELLRANEKISKANQRLKKANKALDAAEHQRDLIILKIDKYLVESWKSEPDWNVLLEDTNSHSLFLYEYTNALLCEMGLRSSCKDYRTRQRVIDIFFKTKSEDELLKKSISVDFVSKFIDEFEEKKCLNIVSLAEDDCAYELSIRCNDAGEHVTYCIEKMSWGRVVDSISFKNSYEALKHIQLYICKTE